MKKKPLAVETVDEDEDSRDGVDMVRLLIRDMDLAGSSKIMTNRALTYSGQGSICHNPSCMQYLKCINNRYF
ncbi:MAG: hypothetical protein WCW03_03935 [Candidatus Paceibacterota bacterium]|jgi:hypothetical protein